MGGLGNLARTDDAYVRWKRSDEGSSLAFPSCYGRLRGVTNEPVKTWLSQQRKWMEALYYKLCAYAHSRPDSSDGEMWESNGPIYVRKVFDDVFRMQASTYTTCYV